MTIDTGVLFQGIISLLTILGTLVVAQWTRRKTEAEAKKARAEEAQVIVQSALELEKRMEERMRRLETQLDKLKKAYEELKRAYEELWQGTSILIDQLCKKGEIPKWKPKQNHPFVDDDEGSL